MPRWATTLIVVLIAVLVSVALTRNNSNEPIKPADATAPTADAGKAAAPVSPTTPAAATAPTTGAPTTPTTPAAPTPATPAPAVATLKVLAAEPGQPEPEIGGVEKDADKNPYNLHAKFTPWGGGILKLELSRYSTVVTSHIPYDIQQPVPAAGGTANFYPMAASSVTVNGQVIFIGSERWKVITDPKSSNTVAFELTIAAGDKPVLRIKRTWSIAPGRYDVNLAQTLENLSDQPLDVSFTQYGTGDVPDDGGSLGDRRHVTIGYLLPYRNSTEKFVTIDGSDFPRDAVVKGEGDTIWPPKDGVGSREMVWPALANRYFVVAAHAPVAAAGTVPPLQPAFPSLRRVKTETTDENGPKLHLILVMDSALTRLAPAAAADKPKDPKATLSLPLVLYAGPKDPEILKADPVYTDLGIGQVIVYNLGGPCAICTFSWVADGMLGFLHLLHAIVRDWGVSIIILVLVVRGILHPLTKSSQINMMKISKQMQAIAPELERLKAKYKDDSGKLNAETMNLYREKGVNPAAMGLGCLPMFLQMPIWFALYAVLYFAIELRHSPALWGIFQKISGGSWAFLADLSGPDRFITFSSAIHFTIPFFNSHVTIGSINLIPLLMIGVFWFQQKYMQPPPTGQMTDQQRQQQVMMKFSVLLIPIFLYNSPCGLTLYILTSTSIGIVESRRVRKHLEELEKAGLLFVKKPRKPGGFMDKLMKAAEERQRQAGLEGDGGGSPARRKPKK